MDRPHYRVRVGGEERVEQVIALDRLLLGSARPRPRPPDASEEKQRARLRESEPHRRLSLRLGIGFVVVLAERGRRHQAPILGLQPRLPEIAFYLANISDGARRTVDRRRRKSPTHLDELALAVRIRADHRRDPVWKDRRLRRQIAGAILKPLDDPAELVLSFSMRV